MASRLMNLDNKKTVSAIDEETFLQIIPLVQKIIARKLGRRYSESIEDLIQKTLLKLWHWQKTHGKSDLSTEEWQKLACFAARSETTDFFRAKYLRDIQFSQMSDHTNEQVLAVESGDIITGNSRPEVCSLLKLVWKAAQKLTFRQKYAYFFPFSDFIIEFIVCECCSIDELASYFELSEEGLSEVIEQLPLSDDLIGSLLEKKLGEPITPKQIWEARAKAKAKLAAQLKDSVFNERLFVPNRI